MKYVVMGGSGEYAGREEWPVRAFEDESDADRFAKECNDWVTCAQSLWVTASDGGRGIPYSVGQAAVRAKPRHDPLASVRTEYWTADTSSESGTIDYSEIDAALLLAGIDRANLRFDGKP